MSLLEKQRELFEKLQETNYEMFDGDKEDALSFIGDQLKSFPDYANIVIREQIMIPIWQHSCEGEEYRENVQRIDSQRRSAHNRAISGMNILNRLNKNLGLEPFFDIDTEDRYAVADTVGKYVNEVYNSGIGADFDTAVLDRKAEYDSKTVTDKINQDAHKAATRLNIATSKFGTSEQNQISDFEKT